jgi:transposase
VIDGNPRKQKIKNYGIDFKLRAVQLSNQPGVLIKDVAESLCIHPFMLSKWRKQVRDGELTGRPPPLEPDAVAELRRLREVEKQFNRLQMEHDLVKKAIRFASQRKGKPSGKPANVPHPSEYVIDGGTVPTAWCL